MKVHMVGVCGTGMAALARLLKEAGHEVRGSDLAFDPPMGPELAKMGVECMQGYAAEHLDWGPERVIVGNAIRKTNPEAERAECEGQNRLSMSAALRAFFLEGRTAVTVTGTHGKTTTSAMLAHLLSRSGLEPGWFIGGLPKTLPGGAAIGRASRSLLPGGTRAPFVIEGDEYDAVYWHKEPKFLDYVGGCASDVTLLTSIEHDHIDIYPDEASYLSAFTKMAAKTQGLLIGDARDKLVRQVLSAAGHCERVLYAIEGDDTGDELPTWLGVPANIDDAGNQYFDLFIGGSSAGRFSMKVPGAHNIRNAVASLAACTMRFGIPLSKLRASLSDFAGVRRRQDLIGEPGGVRLYDDFAHHPTAVDETLRALRSKHPNGKLYAVFEPRSATACRALHQSDYVTAFGSADGVIFAPLGRTNVPEDERLDLKRLASEIGVRAKAARSIDEIVFDLVAQVQPGDTVALLSNGAFGGIYAKLTEALSNP
jgi:UDP-N-acetylmuramate: L-alanyl-gamma-D-glutamyl-meso-diaminopimelate ligase